MRIEDSVFMITGGGSGLGLAAARQLLGQGGKVLLLDINAEAGQRAAAELGEGARFVQADITREEDGRVAVAQALEAFGAVHGLVNCAGIAPAEKILGRSGVHGLDSFRRTVEVNLIGSFNLLRLAAEAMAQNPPNAEGERGVIVNTASVAAFDGQIGQAAYAASKGGVAAMTLPAARELARSGIRVMCIAPGIFETPMMAGMDQKIQDALAAAIPFPSRLGTPADYASLVLELARNVYINGECIRLDGAIRLAPR